MAKKTNAAAASIMSRDEVVSHVEAFRNVVASWEAADGPMVQWQGHPTKGLSRAVEDAAAEMFQALATTSIEPSAQELVLAVDRFELAMIHWWQRVEAGAANVNPQGGNEVWGPWTDVLHALEPRRRRQPTPITTLTAGGVPHRQIAKEYGWYRPDGVTPDESKVHEEIRNPGTHYKPDEYVHPTDRKRDAQIAEKWKERTERLGERSPFNEAKDQQLRRLEGKPKANRPEAPESVEELIRQNVPVSQIAKMKRIDPEEVRRIAADMGRMLDDPSVAKYSVDPKQSVQTRHQLELRKINSHPEYQDLEDRIIALADDGHPAQIIAQVLNINGYPEVEPKQVEDILAAVQDEEPAQT